MDTNFLGMVSNILNGDQSPSQRAKNLLAVSSSENLFNQKVALLVEDLCKEAVLPIVPSMPISVFSLTNADETVYQALSELLRTSRNSYFNATCGEILWWHTHNKEYANIALEAYEQELSEPTYQSNLAFTRIALSISVSDSTVSRITDKILPIAKEWQQRPLESIYAVVFLDAIHYHVRSEGQIVKKAVYIAIGIDLDGRKDVLGMWVGENESAKFWATVLNGLKNRGVEDIFIACTDNLTGFDAAIHATFPKTEIQNCIIHQLRNSSKYVSYKDLKALMADLKAVYAAVDEQAALDALDAFGERWDKKYPKISQSWRAGWTNLSTYFKYPQEVRRLIYTTNAIEGFNRQLRKVTKAKSVFPTDDSLLKMLYLAMMDITKKWTGRRQDWSLIHAQMAIYFAERMPE